MQTIKTDCYFKLLFSLIHDNSKVVHEINLFRFHQDSINNKFIINNNISDIIACVDNEEVLIVQYSCDGLFRERIEALVVVEIEMSLLTKELYKYPLHAKEVSIPLYLITKLL